MKKILPFFALLILFFASCSQNLTSTSLLVNLPSSATNRSVSDLKSTDIINAITLNENGIYSYEITVKNINTGSTVTKTSSGQSITFEDLPLGTYDISCKVLEEQTNAEGGGGFFRLHSLWPTIKLLSCRRRC